METRGRSWIGTIPIPGDGNGWWWMAGDGKKKQEKENKALDNFIL